MSLISVENLSHSFGEKKIFESASFKLLKGEHIGLVGANGKGKSTFMKIIANKFSPNTVDLKVDQKIRIGYMDQHSELQEDKTIFDVLKTAFNHMYEKETEMTKIYEEYESYEENIQNLMLEKAGDIQNFLSYTGFYEIEERIKYVASGLGINQFGYETKVNNLSGGQRTKILLCKLLLENPDVLMLDEPTNFLDEKHIEWLKNFLLNYENAFVLISHDNEFLNSVINVVYYFNNFVLKRYKGDYQNFLNVSQVENEHLEKSAIRQQDQIKKLETFIAKNKARASTTGRAQSRQKMLDKMDVIKLPPKTKPAIFYFKENKAPVKNIMNLKDVVTGYTKALSLPISFDVVRSDKIVIIGANGIGKTTLLKTITKELELLSGSIKIGDYVQFGYFKQEEKFGKNLTTYEFAYEHFPYDKKTSQEIRKELAKVGLVKEHIDNSINNLSGGEQAKLRFAILMNNPYNVLILDEPTNHLDKDSKANLKKALIDFNGTVIFVCHEPEFYKGLANIVLDAKDWIA